jgi:hypothetical protein
VLLDIALPSGAVVGVGRPHDRITRPFRETVNGEDDARSVRRPERDPAGTSANALCDAQDGVKDDPPFARAGSLSTEIEIVTIV